MRDESLEIDLDGRSYPLRIRKMAQSRSISVSADTVKGVVRLTMPRYASTAQALRFVQAKSNWLSARFAEALPIVPIIDGAEIAYQGEPHIIRWSPDFARKPSRANGEIHVGGPSNRIERRILSWMKAEARAAYADDLNFYCKRANADLPRLSVGDARRRWGSCSERGSIRLNWRLIMAPLWVRRSVIAHEVAHLRHMNHSKAFYGFLDEIYDGDRSAADQWLKRHGGDLHLIGATNMGVPTRQ